MIYKTTFTIVGGDLRYAHLANTLAQLDEDYTVYGLFLPEDIKLSPRVLRSNELNMVLPQSDVVIFALPILTDNIHINAPQSQKPISFSSCLEYISPHAIVLGGKIPLAAAELAKEQSITLIDYLEREEFAVLNSVPTAEGAIALALNELPITLFGANCMIIGFGRVSRSLAKLLAAFGADVKVIARKYSDLAWIKIYGYTPVHISELKSHLLDVDVLFNTVPAVVLGEDKLSLLKRNCLVIDLASKPGGVDFETAKTLSIKTIWALSLPGKVAPISAGEITLDTILNILKERGTIN